ncbi:MAG: LL-diaminopimelate aminotransferase [bacterium]
MVIINNNYLKLKDNYLFSEIATRVMEYKKSNPSADIIKLGIGDVVKALPECSIKGLHEAVDEMADDKTFRGYGPEQGYDFLREKIIQYDYSPYNINLERDEIFVSDGAKCDTGNIQELFSADAKVAVSDPVYPVYVDTNIIAGRNIHYLASTEDNNFIPSLPSQSVDLIYLCYPNNPTGITISKEVLREWVKYAQEHQAIILFDAAYEAYIRNEEIPHSIFEIEEAQSVAIEFRSFSKSAGFTGLRCAYTVVPKELFGYDEKGGRHLINHLWRRRQATKFNGVSYPVQKAALSLYTEEGQKQIKALTDYYMDNARIIISTLTSLGFTCYGGKNAPYIWLKTPHGQKSWEFFDFLLTRLNIVSTPGVGFGACGEGFIRLSAFGIRSDIETAMNRFKDNAHTFFI